MLISTALLYLVLSLHTFPIVHLPEEEVKYCFISVKVKETLNDGLEYNYSLKDPVSKYIIYITQVEIHSKKSNCTCLVPRHAGFHGIILIQVFKKNCNYPTLLFLIIP